MPKLLNDDAFEEQLLLKDRALAATAEGVTISNPALPDNPLIYVNEGFERLTGYSAAEVIGRNCRFLQGPDTHPDAMEEIRAALRNDRPCTVQILNYRKDGTPFWNRLSITPVRDSEGRVTHHIGIQSDVTVQKNTEDALRVAKGQLEVANEAMKKDLHAAVRVQRALLPSNPPRVDGVTFAWRFQPSAELAGDLLNVFRLDDDHIGLYVLDVSGHGVASALMSVAVSRLLAPATSGSLLFADSGERLASPGEVANELNEYFPFDPRTSQYFTLLYGILNPTSWEFHYVSAGHAPPIRVPRVGGPHSLESGGPPIGLLPSPELPDRVVRLDPGDRILLYTDGVVEAENPREEEFGTVRLARCLNATRKLPIEESLDSILSRVNKWCCESEPRDDISILALEVVGS